MVAAFVSAALLLGSAWLPMPPASLQPVTMPRASTIAMKGRPSRGMPKKGTMQPGQMVNTGIKSRMSKKDFQGSKEWVRVAEIEDIATTGATKAVAAGKQPGRMGPTGFQEGPEYLWCLVRGDISPQPAADAAEAEGPEVYAVDGSCRSCQFPLTAAEYGKQPNGEPSLTCKCCGTKYSLKNGECLDFLPGKNPVQFAAKMANQNKGVQSMAVLPTRVSKSGKVYLRLPDNTLQD